MTRWAVLLRGVNVGGVTIRTSELRRVLADLPVTDVTTLLASGNIVCSYHGDGGALKGMVEAALRAAFRYEAWVVVLSAERLTELVEACPYPPDSAEEHTYVTLTSDPAVLDEVEQAVTDLDPEARHTRLGPEAAAWVAPVGATLASSWTSVASRARYKPALTDRNLRTLLKVLAAARPASSG